MLVKELVAELLKHGQDDEVGISFEHSHYVSKVSGVGVETRPSSVPAGARVVVLGTSAGDFVPADEV